MNRLKSLFGIMIILFSCSSQSKFANTTWEIDWGHDDLRNELVFKDNRYVKYSAEIGEHYYGTYKVKGDTIILFQERGEYDHQFPNSHHVAGKRTFKLILKNSNQLGYPQNWDSEKKKWKEDFYYTKVENSKK